MEAWIGRILIEGEEYRVFNKIWYHLRCRYDRNYMIKVNETKLA